VYGRAHIGNFRSFMATDLLRRVLRVFHSPQQTVSNAQYHAFVDRHDPLEGVMLVGLATRQNRQD